MFLSSALSSMLLLPVAFCTPIPKHECDLNIEGGEGANVILCYNICDRDCSSCEQRNYLLIQPVDLLQKFLLKSLDCSPYQAGCIILIKESLENIMIRLDWK